MDKLPNEICVHILMFLSLSDLLVMSRVSKELYYLFNLHVDFKQIIDSVWSMYVSKKLYFSSLDECRLGIFQDLIKSFKIFKSRQYLVTCLEKKLLSCFEQLHPVCVCFYI